MLRALRHPCPRRPHLRHLRPTLALVLLLGGAATGRAAATVSLVLEAPESGPATQHGLAALAAALQARGWTAVRPASPEAAPAGPLVLVDGAAAAARRLPGDAAARQALSQPEGLAIRRLDLAGRSALLVGGADDRGLMYALLDAADRVGWTDDAADPFREVRETVETPATRDRSVSVYTMNRAYWESRFYDETYWTRYFDMLAADRFNKFLVIFGYENGGFLAPCYPYFFDTPGFPDVHLVGLTAARQERNRAALQRLIELAHARGIAFAVGIWDHIFRGGVQSGGIEWVREYAGRSIPNTVEGVTGDNINAYTMASLQKFFATFPGIDEIQFRIHEESGLTREEMDGFWRDVFAMGERTRPGLLFEARGKGTPDSIIDTALDLGVNLRVETKFWMEQMGLPFHPTHVNPRNQHDRRHGYADFLRYPQRYTMNWRLWTGGTTRVLLWGDPDYVRRYVQAAQLYASPNWDVNEPLATKMEAQAPDQEPFALMPERYRYYDYEFERYWHFFQVWGRVGYNPAAPAEVWDHEFACRFGAAAGPHVAAGLHRASTILPRIVAAVFPYRLFPTTRGWAERQSLGTSLAEYAANDTTDLQQFETFAEAARRLVEGGATTRRPPEVTARWLDDTAAAVLAEVAQAERTIGARRGREFDSTMTDLRILAQLARFHARRVPAAVHYNLWKFTRDVHEFDAAITGERAAIDEWRTLVTAAGDRYTFNLAMGIPQFDLSGHWRDELAQLESAFAALTRERAGVAPAAGPARAVAPRPRADDTFAPEVAGARLAAAAVGRPLRITARVTDASGVKAVTLRYRHVTQFEDYEALAMEPTGQPDEYAATVPGGFLVPEWDFMYFIEALDTAGNGTQWPDLDRETPYVIVHLDRGR